MKLTNLRYRLSIFFSCRDCGGWGCVDTLLPWTPDSAEPNWDSVPCRTCNETGYRFWVGRMYGTLERRLYLWNHRRKQKRLPAGKTFEDGTKDPFGEL